MLVTRLSNQRFSLVGNRPQYSPTRLTETFALGNNALLRSSADNGCWSGGKKDAFIML